MSQALFLSLLGPEIAWCALSKVILVSKVKKEVKEKDLPGLETHWMCLEPFFCHHLRSLLPCVVAAIHRIVVV